MYNNIINQIHSSSTGVGYTGVGTEKSISSEEIVNS